MRRGGYYPPLNFCITQSGGFDVAKRYMYNGTSRIYALWVRRSPTQQINRADDIRPYKNIKNFLSGMEIEFEIWYNKKVSVNERKAFDFYERIP